MGGYPKEPISDKIMMKEAEVAAANDETVLFPSGV
jgi:hypothetical protein